MKLYKKTAKPATVAKWQMIIPAILPLFLAPFYLL